MILIPGVDHSCIVVVFILDSLCATIHVIIYSFRYMPTATILPDLQGQVKIGLLRPVLLLGNHVIRYYLSMWVDGAHYPGEGHPSRSFLSSLYTKL